MRKQGKEDRMLIGLGVGLFVGFCAGLVFVYWLVEK